MISGHFCIILPRRSTGLLLGPAGHFSIALIRELIIRPQSFSRILSFIFALCCLFPGAFLFGQVTVLENGQPTLAGSEASVHVDNPFRRKIDLSGTWSYTTDEETWGDVKIPASFDYKGRVVLMRKFTLDRTTLSASAFHLVGLGINLDAEIYINDVFVGKHVGGYTTVEIDLPESALQLGSENALKIIVTNNLSSRLTLPLRKQIHGWREYAGIFRDVYLLVTPRLWIDRFAVKANLSSDLSLATVDVDGILNSKLTGAAGDTLSALLGNAQPQFVVDLIEKSTGIVVGTSGVQPVSVLPNRDYEVHATIALKGPRVWSPETPDLYVVRGRVLLQQGRNTKILDEFERVTGFRRLDIVEKGFVLNGKPLTLYGVVWHEDIARNGASLTYEQMEKDFTLMKTLGANAVRFAFRPSHPYVLTLCDRYGLLAFEEIPAIGVPPEILDQENFKLLAEQAMTEIVERDRHHPSIVAWGVGDEFDSSDPRTCGFVERVAGAVRKLDARPLYFGSRLFSTNTCAGKTEIAAVRITKEANASLKSSLQAWIAQHPKQPVVLLSYGKDVEPDNRNGWSDPMSQEAQAEFFKKAFATIKDAGIAGSFIDSFADWKGDRPWMTIGTGNRSVYPVGLLSYAREKRAAFEMVKLLYNGEKTNALPIGRYRASFPAAHILWGFAVIFVIAYLYHYNRRFNETFKRAFIRSYNFYADLRDVHTVSIPQTLILAAAVSVTMGVIVSGILYRFRTDSLADYFVTIFVVSDALKEKLIAAIWQPFAGILAFSVLFLAAFPILAFFIKLFAFFVKRRVNWYHAFAVAVWGALPVVFLSPIGMALFKLLQNDFYVLPTFVLVAIFLLWSFLRILKGVAVVYDVSMIKAYAGGFVVLLVMCGGLFIYYETAYSISAYVEFFFHLGRSLS